MTYTEALELVKQKSSLVGKLTKGGIIYNLAIVPTNKEHQRRFLLRFVQNGHDSGNAVIPFINEDVQVWALAGEDYLNENGVLFYDIISAE